MRIGLVASLLLLTATVPAAAQLSISINIGSYPNFTPVPGYPVYYAPNLGANYFFYDGLYWVYQDDNWYSSAWYNGPWTSVSPEYVPAYVLRVPVRYYRAPPVYFRGWRADAPPRWGQHWGPQWEQTHAGWDHWNRNAVPAPAPIPRYQQQYSGNHYPQGAQQQSLYNQHYRYQPRDPQVQQHYPQQGYAQQGAPQQGYPQQGRPPGHAQPVPPNQPGGVTGPQIHNTPAGPVMTGPKGTGGKREPGQDG